MTHRFINADACYDTGTGVLGYNTYVYCLNNPIQRIDWDGKCSKFLGFLWKVDCKQTNCKDSKNYIKPVQGPTYQYNNGRGQVTFYDNENDAKNAYANAKNNEIIVYDARTNDDPNMRVYGSYRITSGSKQQEICEIMIEYNESYPVSPAWNRTVDSMISEWNYHNAAYYFYYKRERTRDCDFNNGDEDNGLWDFARR